MGCAAADQCSAVLCVVEKPFIELKDPRANVMELTVGDYTREPLVPFQYDAYPEPLIQWYGSRCSEH